VTATDLSVLCGAHPATCWAKYGAIPAKGNYCHELALRMLLATLSVHAAKYKRYIVPLTSIYVDYYIRVFVRVYFSPGKTKEVVR